MTPTERHARLEELFFAARGTRPEERGDFLAAACGGDEELLREVESLLAHDPAPSAEARLPQDWSLTPLRPADREPAAEIGPYRLLQKLGEGGMGEVWEAEQERPVRRRVALKLIKWGMDTREVLARFESERQALALMSHPSIARIYDAGVSAEGRPYFAMEYVPGVAITDYCDTQRLTVKERLELFIQVCQGVWHAHQKGVIHRDVKPSNVLVTVEDGRPVPKIIDFGVAKATAQRLTERTLFTQLGQWIGTPEYMSPEQAEMTGLDVDTRTDVYSLGALLYELLVGTQPFAAEELRRAGFDEMRRRIREEEPTRPSTRVSTAGEGSGVAADRRRTDPAALVRELSGDLDWITIKALEKDRTRRYGSPAELAADVERHLRHRPVVACPPSTLYRLGKFVRRHRLGVAAGTLAAAALVLGLAVAGLGLVRARHEAANTRQVADFLAEMFHSLDPSAPLAATSVREILDQGAQRLGSEFEDQPLVRARLLFTIGQTYGRFGAREEARRLLEEALAIQRRQLGEDHPETAATLSVLGWNLLYLRQFRAARSLLERAFELRQRALGPDHPEVAESLYRLAFLHVVLSAPAAARPLLDRALAIQQRALGPDHPDLARTLDLMARLLLRAGDLEGSRPLFERALRIYERALGTDHLKVGWILQQLGRHGIRAGDLAAAELSLERALAIHEKTLGADSGSAARDLLYLAQVSRGRGDDGAARQYLERTLAIHERIDPPGDSSRAWILRDLAGLDDRSGDRIRACERLERALAICERVDERGSACAAWILHDLARLDDRSGDAPRAPERPEPARPVCEQPDRPGDVFLAGILRYLARLDSQLGDARRARARLERARESLERARRIWQEEPEPRREWLAQSAYHLACLSALEGREKQALDLLRQALEQGYADGVIFDDPYLASLRGDPELEAAVAEVRRRRAEPAPETPP